MKTLLFKVLLCTFCSTSCVAKIWGAAASDTQHLLTISTFCCHLRPAQRLALPPFTLLFSQTVPICRHFNCLTLADLTLLPGRHTVTLNDDKAEDGNQTERVSKRRDERSAGRTGIWQPCKGGVGGGGLEEWKRKKKVTCRENEVQEGRSSKLQTIKAVAQLVSEDETFWKDRVWLEKWEMQTNSLKVSYLH